jgi:hypothetical protein
MDNRKRAQEMPHHRRHRCRPSFAGGVLGGGETRGRGEAVAAGAWKESLLEEGNAGFYHKYSYSIYKIFRNIF